MGREIDVWAAPTVQEGGSKNLSGRTAEAVLTKIDVDKLKVNLDHFVEDLGGVIAALKPPGGVSLREVELGIEISVEGGVNLIGSLTAGARAAVTLKFERK
jgi:hypothetical protein